jgi:geranyl-CoA carboxylase alpha subunit
MNTRLQVEHAVTEAIAGFDLVEWQLRVAMGERFTRQQSDLHFCGHAIEARLCAEDPAENFLPQAGRLVLWRPAEGARTDHALEAGMDISPFYDSMMAKVIAHGATREEARERLARALDSTIALGLPTNKAFLAAVLRDEEFAAHGVTTDFIGRRFADIARTNPDAGTLAVASALLAANAGYGEWNSWSNSPERAMKVKLGEAEIDLQHADGVFHIKADEADVSIRLLRIDESDARIAIESTDETVTFTIKHNTVHLARGGQSFGLENTTHAPSARRATSASDSRLLAPMNGRVVTVNVKPGDTAQPGHALIVLEAMKMEHALSVSAPARVRALHVVPGTQVAPGQLLVELEPAL